MDDVTVVDASLTVVLDIRHPPWDLRTKPGTIKGLASSPNSFLLFNIFEKMRSKFTAGVKKEMKGWVYWSEAGEQRQKRDK